MKTYFDNYWSDRSAWAALGRCSKNVLVVAECMHCPWGCKQNVVATIISILSGVRTLPLVDIFLLVSNGGSKRMQTRGARNPIGVSEIGISHFF